MKTSKVSTPLSSGGTNVIMQRPPSRRPLWILVLVCLVSLSLIAAYVYPPQRFSACYYLSSSMCTPFKDWLPPEPVRVYTDNEIIARVVFKDILAMPNFQTKNPKVAFMFLTPGRLPLERLWEKFFQGNEERFSIYIHASREKAEYVSPIFRGREIRSDKVDWGKISLLDAERRLLANALEDQDNQHFVLVSESCVPLHNFDYVYSYLMETNISFIDSFDDPGPHGIGRYSGKMLPEIERKDWRKGAQWFSVKRQHALLIMADSLYYSKFKEYCKSSDQEGRRRNCYADEHYLPTLFNMIDPRGIANWSITHVDWSEGKWHPKSYRAGDVTYDLLKSIASIDESTHVSSNAKKQVMQRPCLWNGMKRPCYLFARKFKPEALDVLVHLFSNFTLF